MDWKFIFPYLFFYNFFFVSIKYQRSNEIMKVIIIFHKGHEMDLPYRTGEIQFLHKFLFYLLHRTMNKQIFDKESERKSYKVLPWKGCSIQTFFSSIYMHFTCLKVSFHMKEAKSYFHIFKCFICIYFTVFL